MKQRWKELAGICLLTALAVWCLRESWRKWPDPIIDSGPQLYNTWRVSLGAVPYHDFVWNYGPLSILSDGLLFKCFGPGIMVLAAANLVIYFGIAVLAYFAFRRAWGAPGAFAATAVFIAAFSFPMLNAVGNYNYALPYANETTHGMLLVLLTVFVAVRWCVQPSRVLAFLLGLCGGLAAVLKPEFMLAAGVLGLAVLILRYRQRKPVNVAEYGLILTGILLPTLLLSFWFARHEPWSEAIVDSCQAWWLVFVNQRGPKIIDEAAYMGFNHGWRNVGFELAFSLSVALVLGAIWVAGWFANRPWRPLLRIVAAAASLILACSVDMGGGFEIGPSFPALIAVVSIFVVLNLRRQINERTIMSLALVLVAGAMLARMALRSRINHFGFIQAAFAGMVLAAFLVAELPRWTGRGRLGQWLTRVGIFIALGIATRAVMAESARNHAIQTQPVGSGVDRFYAFDPKIDDTGEMVNWCAEKMSAVAPNATLLVLPEGAMINYLSRHLRPLPEFHGDETEYIQSLAKTHPDYVIIIWGDQRDGGIPRFGDRGEPGEKIGQWLRQNYTLEDRHHGAQKWALLFHRKPNS